MRGRNLFFIGIVIAVIGLLLILFRHVLADGGIVIAAGILFVLAGALNMFVFLGSRDKEGRSRIGAFGTVFGWIASAAAVVLGLAMLIFNNVFVAIIGFMFAVLLLFAALFQLFVLLFAARPVKLSGWYYLVPTVLVGCAIYIIMRRPDVAGETVDLVLTGSCFILFGLATIIEGLTLGNVRRKALKSANEASEAVLRGERPEKEITSSRQDAQPAADPTKPQVKDNTKV